MDDPIAFFLTWPTYGTWLPGDKRGWVEFKRGWQMPDSVRHLESRAKMKEDACLLNSVERKLVEAQITETCGYRGWTLHALNCRSNHIHIVVGATGTDPKKVRTDLKAWCTRRLKDHTDIKREKWWAERGSIRWIFNEDSLETVILYVAEAQDRKDRDQSQPEA